MLHLECLLSLLLLLLDAVGSLKAENTQITFIQSITFIQMTQHHFASLSATCVPAYTLGQKEITLLLRGHSPVPSSKLESTPSEPEYNFVSFFTFSRNGEPLPRLAILPRARWTMSGQDDSN